MTPEESQKLEAARKAWEETVLKPALDRAPERPGLFSTSGGNPVERVYTPADLAGLDYSRDLGFPGQYPFTRGV